MKQDLTLNVGTKYNGDGMKKLDSALKTGAKSAQSASQAMSAVSSELGQIGGAAGKATSAVSGLFQAFTQGGLIGVAVAGITAAIGLIVNAFKEAKERAHDAAEAMADGFNKAVEKTVRRIQKIKDALSFKNRENAIEQGFNQAQAGVAQRESQLFIKNRYAPQKAAAKTDFERAKIDAAEKRDLAISDAKYRRSAAFDDMDAANKAVLTTRDSYAKLTKAVDKQASEVAQQRVLLEQSSPAQQYKRLKEAVE